MVTSQDDCVYNSPSLFALILCFLVLTTNTIVLLVSTIFERKEASGLNIRGTSLRALNRSDFKSQTHITLFAAQDPS
jgi:hypothetical protein